MNLVKLPNGQWVNTDRVCRVYVPDLSTNINIEIAGVATPSYIRHRSHEEAVEALDKLVHWLERRIIDGYKR